MATCDLGGRVLSVSESLAAWLEEDPATLLGRPVAEILGEAGVAPTPATAEFMEAPGDFRTIQLPGVRETASGWLRLSVARSGDLLFLHADSVLAPRVHLEEGGCAATPADGPEGGALRLRLMRAEARLDNLMRRWPGVIFSQRADMTLEFANPRIEEMTGIPLADWMRRPDAFWGCIHEADLPELQQHVRRAAQQGMSLATTFRIRHSRTGRVAYVLEHRHPLRSAGGLLLGFEGVWLDVSRQTIAERRLSTAAWRDTLAVLTMGLAHDFGNILAGIHALAETLEPAGGGDESLRDGLGLIKRNAMQASHLVRRVLSLHQGRPGEYGYSDLNEQVDDLAELVRKIIPRRIQFEVATSGQALPVYVDAVELRQVFINLTMNAVDAMPHSGRLLCATSRHLQPPAMGHLQGVFPRLPAVCLSVEDNGLGIPARNLPSIFDPFFTTKPVDKGSGLGLYNARLFVEKHHGAISVDSAEGRGTTFRLWLPEADFTEEERVQEQAGRRRRSLLVAGPAGRARDITTEFLRRSGYFVVTEAREQHALDLLDSPDYEFDAVLVQVGAGTSPGTGRLLRELRGRKPPVPSVLQVVGINEDEVDTAWLRDATLVAPADLPEREFREKLAALFDPASPR